MNKMKKTEMISIFIIMLVVTIPIYSSTVMASLSGGSMAGSDGVKGYYRRNEDLNINVNARIGSTDITPSQIHINDLSGSKFTTCTPKGDGSFDCSYSLNSGNSNYPKTNPSQTRVVLYNALDQHDSSLMIQGSVDEHAPQIKSFTISPGLVSSGMVNLKYSLYDHSYSASDTNRCSGINRVEVAHGSFLDSSLVNTSPNSCAHLGEMNIPVTDIAETDGLVSLTLTAYDNLGQAASETASFIYDTTPPMATGPLEFRHEDQEISHIKDTPITVDVAFKVMDDRGDLDKSRVTADLSELQGQKKKAECRLDRDGSYQCTVKGVQLRLSIADQYAVVGVMVEAYDNAGNTESTYLTKTVYYDNEGPVLKKIETDKKKGDVSYAGEITDFIVTLEEGGAGMSKKDIMLDLRSINGLRRTADNCTSSGNEWTCHWHDIKSETNSGEKTVSVSGADRLGNTITGELTETVIVDKTPPQVVSSTIEALGAGDRELPNVIKTTDHVRIKAKVRERSSFSSAHALFSPIVTSQGNESKPGCNFEGNDIHNCVFESGSIVVPGYIDTNIPLRFTDVAGNSVTYNQRIVVYNYSSEENPNYWTHTVSCSPSRVDRGVTNMIEYRVMCSVNLIPLTGNQETIITEFDHCEDEVQGSRAYIKSSDLINNERGSTNPYLSFRLTQTEMRINEISLTCPIGIRTRAGNVVTQYPEIEEVKVKIGLYNMPMGEFDKSVEKEIKDVQDEIAVGWEWVSTLKEIVFYIEKLCGILDLLHKLQVFWGFLESIPSILQSGFSKVSVEVEKTNGLISVPYLSPLCEYIECDKTLWGNWYNGKKSLWWDGVRDQGEGFAQGGFKDMGGYETFLKKHDLGSMFPESPKDSIILSMATGCIPGIIYNIEKYRQIQCNYGVCLWDSAENNVPINTCDEQKGYLECKFVWGEALQFLPIHWFRSLLQQITYIFSDPLSLVFGILGGLCPPVEGKVHGLCVIVKGLSIISQIAEGVTLMFKSQNWKIQGDMCEEYFDRLDELKKEEISV